MFLSRLIKHADPVRYYFFLFTVYPHNRDGSQWPLVSRNTQESKPDTHQKKKKKKKLKRANNKRICVCIYVWARPAIGLLFTSTPLYPPPPSSSFLPNDGVWFVRDSHPLSHWLDVVWNRAKRQSKKERTWYYYICMTLSWTQSTFSPPTMCVCLCSNRKVAHFFLFSVNYQHSWTRNERWAPRSRRVDRRLRQWHPQSHPADARRASADPNLRCRTLDGELSFYKWNSSCHPLGFRESIVICYSCSFLSRVEWFSCRLHWRSQRHSMESSWWDRWFTSIRTSLRPSNSGPPDCLAVSLLTLR